MVPIRKLGILRTPIHLLLRSIFFIPTEVMPPAQKRILPAKIWATVQTIYTVLSEGAFKN